MFYETNPNVSKINFSNTYIDLAKQLGRKDFKKIDQFNNENSIYDYDYYVK